MQATHNAFAMGARISTPVPPNISAPARFTQINLWFRSNAARRWTDRVGKFLGRYVDLLARGSQRICLMPAHTRSSQCGNGKSKNDRQFLHEGESPFCEP